MPDHLGSGNVLREPGRRNVCIGAASGGRLPGRPPHVWPPFERDEMLALIVSKALMLAGDDEITDTSIRARLDAPGSPSLRCGQTMAADPISRLSRMNATSRST